MDTFGVRQIEPKAIERARAMDALEDRVATLCGVINAAHGELVDLIADALDADLWAQWGIHSPTHWLSWQCGLSRGRARQLLALARRRDELPVTLDAVRDGGLSVDQAAVVARHAPAAFEASVAELAGNATVAQLQRTVPRYVFEAAGAQEPIVEADAPVSSEVENDDGPVPTVAEVARRVSMGHNDDGTWDLHARLPGDEGAVVESALSAAFKDLCAQLDDAARGREAGAAVLGEGRVSRADALVAVAESFLADGAARLPSADRYRVLVHLEAAAIDAGSPPLATLHQGPILSPSLRRLLTCDATTAPVIRIEGRPVNVGRAERDIPRATRRMVEHRDHGCRVPGCGQRHWVQIHHIVHWEDGGPTETPNLLLLCPRHHRMHHAGLLAITGNADVRPGAPGAVEFRTAVGDLLEPVGRPQPPPPDQTLGELLTRDPDPYQHPSGERLRQKWVDFHPTPPARPTPTQSLPPASEPCDEDCDGETITVHGAGWDDVAPEPGERIDPWAILEQIRRRPGA